MLTNYLGLIPNNRLIGGSNRDLPHNNLQIIFLTNYNDIIGGFIGGN